MPEYGKVIQFWISSKLGLISIYRGQDGASTSKSTFEFAHNIADTRWEKKISGSKNLPQQQVLECTSKMLTRDKHYSSAKFILSIPSPIFL